MTLVEQPLSRIEMYEPTDSVMPATPTSRLSPSDPAQIAVTAPPRVASGSVSGTTIVGHVRTELNMGGSYAAFGSDTVVGCRGIAMEPVRRGSRESVTFVRLTFLRSVARPVPRGYGRAARRLPRVKNRFAGGVTPWRRAAAAGSAGGPKPGRVNCSEKLGGAGRERPNTKEMLVR